MSTTTTNSTISPVICKPWCEDQSGHTNAGCFDDQYCMSQEVKITASHYPAEMMIPGEVYEMDTFNVYAGHYHKNSVTRVILGRGDSEFLHMTAVEARQVAAALIATADMIEEDGADDDTPRRPVCHPR